MDNDCVVVPGWGAFIAQYSEPVYNAVSHIVEKPVRQVGFNASVTHHDGMLAQSLVRREGMTYDNAMNRIRQGVAAFKMQIATGQELPMGRLGFFRNNDGRTEFEPFYNTNGNDQYFGLRSFTFPTLHDRNAQSTASTSADIPTKERPWWLQRPWQAAASIITLLVLTVLLSTPIIVNQEQHQASMLPVQKSTQTVDWNTMSSDFSVALTPKAKAEENRQALLNGLPSTIAADEQATPNTHYLVVASLSSLKRAQKYLAIHPDIDGKARILKKSKHHYYVYVAQSQDKHELRDIKAQLPRKYKAWISK